MDERDIEQGYARFNRKLNGILRTRDVKAFKAHVAAHPAQAGRLSLCLGLNDNLAEIEMYKAILIRAPLKDLHGEARQWLMDRDIEPPARKISRRRKKPFAGRGKARG